MSLCAAPRCDRRRAGLMAYRAVKNVAYLASCCLPKATLLELSRSESNVVLQSSRLQGRPQFSHPWHGLPSRNCHCTHCEPVLSGCTMRDPMCRRCGSAPMCTVLLLCLLSAVLSGRASGVGRRGYPNSLRRLRGASLTDDLLVVLPGKGADFPHRM